MAVERDWEGVVVGQVTLRTDASRAPSIPAAHATAGNALAIGSVHAQGTQNSPAAKAFEVAPSMVNSHGPSLLTINSAAPWRRDAKKI